MNRLALVPAAHWSRTVPVGIICLLTCAGCLTGDAKWIRQHGRQLDSVQATVEAYGTVAMSAPLLSLPDDRFAFDLQRTAQQYYEDAKTSVQGSASGLDQTFQGFGFNASVQVDPVQTLNYATALQAALGQHGVAAQRDQLRADAARVRYEAALEAAGRTDDAAQRAVQIAEAKTAYAAALADPSARNTLPALATGAGANVPAAATLATNVSDPTAILAQNKFAGPLGLRTPSTPSINARSALITAAGDKAVQALFNVLGQPAAAQKLTNASVLVGLTMVSVNPGWLTREGFAADITMQPELRFVPARDEALKRILVRKDLPADLRRALAEDMGALHAAWLPDETKVALAGAARLAAPPPLPADLRLLNTEEDKADGVDQDMPPLTTKARAYVEDDALDSPGQLAVVAGLSPLNDTQTLDLAASRRRRTEFALGLALAFRSAGQEAQANLLERWARQTETDAQTRNSEATLSAFSSGTAFGYRLMPSFHAIADPTASRAQPGQRLAPVSFPAVLTLGIDRRHLRLAIVYNPRNASYALAEPALRFVQLPHWRPLDRSHAGRRLDLVAQLDGARILAENGGRLDAIKSRGLRNVADYRIKDLKSSFNGGFNTASLPLDSLAFALPAKPGVRIQKVLPADFALEVDADGKPKPEAAKEITIYGENLAEVDLSAVKVVTGNASLVPGKPPRLDGAALIIPLMIDSAESSVVLTLPGGRDPVPVVFPVALKSPKAQPKAPFVVKVETKTGETTTAHSVEIPATAAAATVDSARQLLAAVRESTATPPTATTGAGVSVNVNAKP